MFPQDRVEPVRGARRLHQFIAVAPTRRLRLPQGGDPLRQHIHERGAPSRLPRRRCGRVQEHVRRRLGTRGAERLTELQTRLRIEPRAVPREWARFGDDEAAGASTEGLLEVLFTADLPTEPSFERTVKVRKGDRDGVAAMNESGGPVQQFLVRGCFHSSAMEKRE